MNTVNQLPLKVFMCLCLCMQFRSEPMTTKHCIGRRPKFLIADMNHFRRKEASEHQFHKGNRKLEFYASCFQTFFVTSNVGAHTSPLRRTMHMCLITGQLTNLSVKNVWGPRVVHYSEADKQEV